MNGVTIFIPAYNEEKNIRRAVTGAAAVASSETPDFEILVVDDGSRDRTGTIADELACKDAHIRVIHHPRNSGLGTCFRDAIGGASKRYFTGFPGDADVSHQSLRTLLRSRGTAPIVFSYLCNQQDRPFIRRVLSIAYTRMINAMFGLNVRYYNGYCIAEVSSLRQLPLISDGHTIFAELIIRAINAGHRYQEIPFCYVRRADAKTHVATPANLYRIIRNMIRLFVDIRIRRKFLISN